MKTQNTKGKATALEIVLDGAGATGCAMTSYEEIQWRNSLPVRQARNEHAALVAVAEAAQEFESCVADFTRDSNYLPGEIQRNYITCGLRLKSALAALAAVLKGAQ